MKNYNHLVNVAFSVEGPWNKFEDIPLDALIAALERRVTTIVLDCDINAFGEEGDQFPAISCRDPRKS
jgi:heme oxygenase